MERCKSVHGVSLPVHVLATQPSRAASRLLCAVLWVVRRTCAHLPRPRARRSWTRCLGARIAGIGRPGLPLIFKTVGAVLAVRGDDSMKVSVRRSNYLFELQSEWVRRHVPCSVSCLFWPAADADFGVATDAMLAVCGPTKRVLKWLTGTVSDEGVCKGCWCWTLSS